VPPNRNGDEFCFQIGQVVIEVLTESEFLTRLWPINSDIYSNNSISKALHHKIRKPTSFFFSLSIYTSRFLETTKTNHFGLK